MTRPPTSLNLTQKYAEQYNHELEEGWIPWVQMLLSGLVLFTQGPIFLNFADYVMSLRAKPFLSCRCPHSSLNQLTHCSEIRLIPLVLWLLACFSSTSVLDLLAYNMLISFRRRNAVQLKRVPRRKKRLLRGRGSMKPSYPPFAKEPQMVRAP